MKGKQLAGGSAAEYSAEARGKDKGDTIYVPEGLSIDNVAHRSQVSHELNHAADDARSTQPWIRSEVELDAYRAQAAYLLDQIGGMKPGDPRDAAAKQAGGIMNGALGRALVLESRKDKPRFEAVLIEINGAAPADRK